MLAELAAHIRQAPKITLLGNFLISFVLRILQVNVHVPCMRKWGWGLIGGGMGEEEGGGRYLTA